MRRLLPLILCALFGGLLLHSCAARFDSDQTRLCRQVIPAVTPAAGRIDIERSGLGPRPGMLRMIYRVGDDPDTQRRHIIDCLFATEATSGRRGTLIGVAVDGRPMNEASFYLLRRFYLENRAEPPVDPAAPRLEELPRLSSPIAYGLQQALAVLPTAAIYALLASAYALIYGLTGRILLGFGEIAALGALAGIIGVSLALQAELSTPASALLIAFAVAIPVAGFHGLIMGRVILSRLKATTGQAMLIATVGLAIALSEYLRLAQGARLLWLPPVFNEPVALARAGDFVVTVTPVGLSLAGFGLALALGLVLLIRHSAFGRAWRAASDDPKAAALFGVDAEKVRDRALALGCACCGAAGIIVTTVYGGMGFAGGFTLGLKALVAAIVGGIGSVAGACLGGIGIALFEALWSATMPIEQRDIAVYTLLILVLILRPGGFFGTAELPEPRQ